MLVNEKAESLYATVLCFLFKIQVFIVGVFLKGTVCSSLSI